MKFSRWNVLFHLSFGLLLTPGVSASEHYVGGPDDPYASIAIALAAAAPGDVIVVRPGNYNESIHTHTSNVTIRGENATHRPVILHPQGVVTVDHPQIRLENLIVDGAYGPADLIRVNSNAHDFTMVNLEVRHSGKDCIDLDSPHRVSIRDSQIHHCLRTRAVVCGDPPCEPAPPCRTDKCRVDAHGIAGGAVRDLTISGTDIHTFSGDALQFDADRLEPGWDNVILENLRIWLEPLPKATAGFAAGVVPGENAIDTKTANHIDRPARLTATNITVYGFRNGLVRMSAFNLKENVQTLFDRITVYDTNIAFRIRGRNEKSPYSAQASISNLLVYHVNTVIRYEGYIEHIEMNHATLGNGISQLFRNVAAHNKPVIVARNLLLLNHSLSREVIAFRTLTVGRKDFVDVDNHNYRLRRSSRAIDRGLRYAENLLVDRDGRPRLTGEAPDLGAFEYQHRLPASVTNSPVELH